MNPYQIIYLLIAYYIGEFICQGGAMASQKIRHLSWLVLHNIIYMVVIFFMYLLGILLFDTWTCKIAIVLPLVVTLAHFVIGFFMSKNNAYYKERNLSRLFWCSVGLGQLLYSGMLIYSLNYLNEY
jgi:hypothetical protein